MPATPAHPAAVLPFLRPFHKWVVPSALIIGSITPDIPYFMGMAVKRPESHSLGGLFWFGLPTGLALYLLFHLFLKRPLLSLLPEFLSRRLTTCAEHSVDISWRGWFTVFMSLLLGTATHVLWDSFTHDNGQAVLSMKSLQVELFSIGTYPVYVYRVLQHLSSIIGMLVMILWAVHWIQTTPILHDPPRFGPPLPKALISIGILCLSAAIGLRVFLQKMEFPISLENLETALSTGAVRLGYAAFLFLCAFSLGWHLWMQNKKIVLPS